LMALGLLALIAVGTGCEPAVSESARVAEHTHRHEADLPPGELPDRSVYQLEGEWYWDQHGETRALNSLAGRVQVASMVYTHCGYTCPQVLLDMKRIEGLLGPTAAADVGFVLVSIDPERDTPERLAHFASTARLDPARWTLLSGPDERILELATLLGVRYRRDSDSDFSHSNVLLVLSPDGELLFRQDGLGLDPDPLLDAVNAARGMTGR
jgi:protein SCO1